MKNYTKKLDPKDIANMEDITGGSEPAAYLKSAEVSGKQLKLKNKDDSYTTYDPDLSKVTGTASGDNWSTITIDGVSKNIPSGGSDVQFDNQTIIEGTGGKKKTAAGGWREVALPKFSGNGTADGTSQTLALSSSLTAAITDGENIRVNISGPAGMLNSNYKVMESHGELAIFIDGGYDGLYLTVQDGAIGATVTINDFNEENIPAGTYNVGLGGGYTYHTIDGNYIPLDDDTMGLDANGKLKCLLEPGVDYGDGNGIHIDNDNNINVNFGGNLVYTDNDTKWENQKFVELHTDVYGIEDTTIAGDIFEVGKTYKLISHMFGEDASQYLDARSYNVSIQGTSITAVGVFVGAIQGMNSYIINYEYEGSSKRPALVIEGCQASVPFGDDDISSVVLQEVTVSPISHKVIPINTDTMEIDYNGNISPKPYTAGAGISITNNVIKSVMSFTYDSATGTLAIVNEAE